MFGNLIDRIRLLFRKDKKSYLRFYEILGFYPHRIEFYEQAVVHRSIGIKSAKGRPLNNERLEFLGDAILDAVVADILYKKFEGKREGFLTNTRSKIVQRETLNRVGAKIGLDRVLRSSTHQQAHNSHLLGNAFEALVGAIYLDRGYDACVRFMEKRIIAPYLNLDKLSRKEMNFKSKLIEWSQKSKCELAFDIVGESYDEEQCLMFECVVKIENTEAGRGKGYSKKEAQQEAARQTLKKIKGDQKFSQAIYALKSKRENPEEGQPSDISHEAVALKDVKAQELTPSEHPDEGVVADVADGDAPAETTKAENDNAYEAVADAHEEDDEHHIEVYEDVERIISQAEEAAFREAEAESSADNVTEKKDDQLT